MFKKISLLALLISGGSAYCAEAKMKSDMDAIMRMLQGMPAAEEEQVSPHTRENVNDLDDFGNTPLHNAMVNNDLSEVILLLTLGADVNAQNFYGHTPLMYGIVEKKRDLNPAIVNQILSHMHSDPDRAFEGHKAIRHDVTDRDGMIALEHAQKHLGKDHAITKRILSGMSGR